MEFKRFYTFFYDVSCIEFDTYLPIRLDATCKGFQHMALLSNENTLFKELNLTIDNIDEKTEPKDFYNFLLHKVTNLCYDKVKANELFDSKGGSFKRLLDFMCNRTH